MASSLFADSSCLLLLAAQARSPATPQRGPHRQPMDRGTGTQSKGGKAQFLFPADCPYPYFCLRSAMKVGTETKHKGQAGNWPKLQGEVQTLVSPATKECWLHSKKFQEPRATPAPEPSCRLLPPGTLLRLLQGEECGGREPRGKTHRHLHFQPRRLLLGKGV